MKNFLKKLLVSTLLIAVPFAAMVSSVANVAVASELNNRKRIGFETESDYIEIINKRLEQI